MSERNDRGHYRVTPVSAADDPDVHTLSGEAFKLYMLLRLSLPTTAIGVVYGAVMCERMQCDRAELEKLYSELERPTVIRPRGWVRREANVVWLIDAFADDRGLTPKNVAFHVKYVRRLTEDIDQRLAIVAEFKARYRDWFEDPPERVSGPSREGVKRVLHMRPSREGRDTIAVTPAVSVTPPQKSGDSLKSERRRGSHVGLAADEESPLRSLARETQQLDVMAIADFAVAFYADADDDRQADVVRQLRQLMAGERVTTPFGLVGAYGHKRLAEKCRLVSHDRRRLRSPDSAIVYLFTKLLDTSDVSQAYQHELRTAEEESRQVERATAAQVADWERANPARATAIRNELAADLPEIPAEPVARDSRRPTPAERAAREQWEAETMATRFVLSIGVRSRIIALIAEGSRAGVA